jgi:hypothetical protein
MGPPPPTERRGAQARVLAAALAVFAFIYATTLMQVGAAIRLRSCPPAWPPAHPPPAHPPPPLARRSPSSTTPPPPPRHHPPQALPAAHAHLHALTLTASAGLGLWGYLLTALTDPGRVPPGWAPDAEAALEAVKRRDGRARRCAKCAGAGKPPRAHHCRRCGRCVLMMDHRASRRGRGVGARALIFRDSWSGSRGAYGRASSLPVQPPRTHPPTPPPRPPTDCAFTGGCVGHGNFRAFLVMTLYLAAAAAHAAALLAAAGARAALGPRGAAPRSRAGGAALAAALLAVLPAAVGLITLAAWNLAGLARGATTIERHEGVRARVRRGGGGGGGAHSGDRGSDSPAAPADVDAPYDRGGLARNAAAALGPLSLGWLLPAPAAARGDGVTFLTRWDRAR